MPSPLPRQDRWKPFARTVPSASAFPEIQAGRLLHHPFRGLLSVHSRYGLHARRVAYATLYTGGSDGFVSFTAAPIATGWSEQFPGGTHTRSEPAPFHGARDMGIYRQLLRSAAIIAVMGATGMGILGMLLSVPAILLVWWRWQLGTVKKAKQWPKTEATI